MMISVTGMNSVSVASSARAHIIVTELFWWGWGPHSGAGPWV